MCGRGCQRHREWYNKKSVCHRGLQKHREQYNDGYWVAVKGTENGITRDSVW